MVVPESAQVRSFLEYAIEWRATGDEALLLRMVRSRCSGVPHDIGAAYATLAARTGDLLEAIDRGRLALPAPERDSLLLFAARARRVRASNSEGEGVRTAIAQVFELPVVLRQPFVLRQAQDDKVSGDKEGCENIELAEPQPAQEASGVPGWQRHFSASALNAYAECSRKWFYKYACAAVEDPGSSASAYGTAFHLALEDFHGEFPRPRSNESAAMRRRMRDYVTWAFERNRIDFGTRVEF